MGRATKTGHIMHIPFATALLNILEPIAAILDKDFPVEAMDHGHERPSRQDRGTQILIGNFCRDVYQQIYGAPKTASYQGFSGVKDTFDRAESQLARHYEMLSRNGDTETAESDPETIRLMKFYDTTRVRYEALTELLSSLQDVHQTIFGTSWQYQKPGSAPAKAPAEAIAALKTIMAKKAQASAKRIEAENQERLSVA